jgi:hypothetical protein
LSSTEGTGAQGSGEEALAGEEPKTRAWTKRDAETGLFMDNKKGGKPFKGVRRETRGK